MNLLIGVLLGILAQILTFIQLQGQFKFPLLHKKYYWLMLLMGIPISAIFMFSVKHMVAYFDGETWPSRLIGFALGTMVFTAGSYLMFGEVITLKTAICVLLAVLIVLVQLFM
jgi:hypothetical protein